MHHADDAGQRSAGRTPQPCRRQDLSALIEGKDVAFLTLGDPGVYSTNTYVHKKIMNRGFETEIVPGITSFCAAAASLNIPLCEAGETLHIIPASYDDLENNLSLKGPKVLMKAWGDNLKP